MLNVPLHHPEPLQPDYARNYHVGVANLIKYVYADICNNKGDAQSFIRASNILSPMLNHAMAHHQRLRIYYLTGQGHLALGENACALHWFDEALTVAHTLHDIPDLIYLSTLKGKAHRAIDKFKDAISDYSDALGLTDYYTPVLTSPVAAFRVDLTSRLASYHVLLGNYRRASHMIDSAFTSLFMVDNAALERAALDWAQALLYRSLNNPALAWFYAVRSANVYFELGDPLSAGRIRTLAAEIALDNFDRAAEGGRNKWLIDARFHQQLSLNLAREFDDPQGLRSNQLTKMRLARVQIHDHSHERQRYIELIADDARIMGDSGLLYHSFVSLGDELINDEGSKESGLWCYRQAIQAIDGSDMPGIIPPAKRVAWGFGFEHML